MKNSIFKKTMVDMSYQQIEELLKNNASVLIPISVVEEHGPRLCTGVDVYLTGVVYDKIKEFLAKSNINAMNRIHKYTGICHYVICHFRVSSNLGIIR